MKRRAFSTRPEFYSLRMATIRLKEHYYLLSAWIRGSQQWDIHIEQSIRTHAHAHTQHAGLSSYPGQDPHTPCTAPGCSMGHLLRTEEKKMFSV